MDREKVIKAFEICNNNEDGIVCKNCPYKEDKWNGAWEDETGETCFQTLHADVLALLKEQEAVKPIRKKLMFSETWECGNCHEELFEGDVIRDNYCCNCGRKVEWK